MISKTCPVLPNSIIITPSRNNYDRIMIHQLIKKEDLKEILE
jgi:hypothetical protein